MIDKAIFLGMNGAANSMRRLEVVTNNLSNAATTGFKQDLMTQTQYPLEGGGIPARTYALENHVYPNFKQGPIVDTGKPLDVAISGDGFIAVQSSSGGEAYTRNGSFIVKNGLLTTQTGQLVLGVNGIINIPPNVANISIGRDGSISVRERGADPTEPITIGQLKLVNPATTDLHKGEDGYFVLGEESGNAPISNQVQLVPGAVEGSNVSAVDQLTNLIELSRQFDMDVQLMKTVGDDTQQANQLLNV